MLDLDKLIYLYEHALIDDWGWSVSQIHDNNCRLLLTSIRVLQEYPEKFGCKRMSSFISEILEAADERNIFIDSEERYNRIKKRYCKFTHSALYSYRAESIIKAYLSLSGIDKCTLKFRFEERRSIKNAKNEMIKKLRDYIYEKYQIYPLIPLLEQDIRFCLTLTESDIKFLEYYYQEKEVNK